jgi:hypothetical protein
VYAELRRLASSYLRSERPDHTLQSTALVHEAIHDCQGSISDGESVCFPSSKTTDSATRKGRWRQARACFEKSLPAFIDLRDRKIATGPEAAMPDEVVKEMSNYDKALRK